MIGKGKSISHTKACMCYGWNQEKDAEIVFKEFLHGDSPDEFTKEFKMLQDQNSNCTKNTLSFIISPTIEDGKRLDKSKLEEISKRFMNEMKLGERQAIAFVHKDKEHKHIHLYVNRIDFKGAAYNDSFIGKRSQLAAEKVAERMGLTTVKQVQFEKQFNLREIRTEIKRRHDLTMKQFKPRSFDETEGSVYFGRTTVYWRTAGNCRHLSCQSRTQPAQRRFEETINPACQISRSETLLCASRGFDCPEPLQGLGA